MKISNRQLAKDLYQALHEVKEKERSQVLTNFVELLHRLRKLSQADRIIVEYVQYEKEQNGEITLEVTTAHDLDNTIKKELQKKFGEKVDIVEKIDKEILGGIIIKSNNTIYDASVRATLHQLKHSL